ncbi:MAG: glutamate racemase [Dysgonamonadaceae bacterium]|nr:glutamate racemase [Dysgonamonadaceae bacterium]MDD4606268.1 glutamate racemase [Dysgonamonadaceae bacterium]
MAINTNLKPGPIGVFDSGYGGLTILSEIKELMPQYDYIYLGDNARAPYGNKSYDLIYNFTLQAVKWFFAQGCQLVIIACNTASAKALRRLQQQYLPTIDPHKRLLGVIRPTAIAIASLSKNGHVAVLGTEATIKSKLYEEEMNNLHPHLKLTSEACPMWVPLVENLEYDKPGADYFVKQHLTKILEKDNKIDTIILGCTHYPLLLKKIKQYIPDNITVISQGKYIAESLKDYMNRHPEMDSICSKNGKRLYYTTDSAEKFKDIASAFLKETIEVEKIKLGKDDELV